MTLIWIRYFIDDKEEKAVGGTKFDLQKKNVIAMSQNCIPSQGNAVMIMKGPYALLQI